eukprot:jgi/Bigna1/72247/fgenesh1_pg.19_\
MHRRDVVRDSADIAADLDAAGTESNADRVLDLELLISSAENRDRDWDLGLRIALCRSCIWGAIGNDVGGFVVAVAISRSFSRKNKGPARCLTAAAGLGPLLMASKCIALTVGIALAVITCVSIDGMRKGVKKPLNSFGGRGDIITDPFLNRTSRVQENFVIFDTTSNENDEDEVEVDRKGHHPANPDATSRTGDECDTWNCTCQGASDLYRISHRLKSFAKSPANVRQWPYGTPPERTWAKDVLKDKDERSYVDWKKNTVVNQTPIHLAWRNFTDSSGKTVPEYEPDGLHVSERYYDGYSRGRGGGWQAPLVAKIMKLWCMDPDVEVNFGYSCGFGVGIYTGYSRAVVRNFKFFIQELRKETEAQWFVGDIEDRSRLGHNGLHAPTGPAKDLTGSERDICDYRVCAFGCKDENGSLTWPYGNPIRASRGRSNGSTRFPQNILGMTEHLEENNGVACPNNWQSFDQQHHIIGIATRALQHAAMCAFVCETGVTNAWFNLFEGGVATANEIVFVSFCDYETDLQ